MVAGLGLATRGKGQGPVVTLDPANLGVALGALLEAPTRLAAMERRFDGLEKQLGAVAAALPPVLLSIPEAAAAFKVSVPTMRRWVKRGEVPSVRVGATIRVDMSRLHGSDELALAREAQKAAGDR